LLQKYCRGKKKMAKIKKGDSVMVIAGGNDTKRPLKGKVGRVLQLVGDDRVVVEGLNIVTRHKRATAPGQESGKISREASIHLSNAMYYAEKIAKPVRIKYSKLADGRKVRGYTDPETKEFVQIDA